MNRIGTMTVIRGNGDLLAVYNDQVDRRVLEIQQRAQMQADAQAARLHMVEQHRNRLLAERLETIGRMDAQARRRRRFIRRIADGIAVIWCTIWVIARRIAGRDV